MINLTFAPKCFIYSMQIITLHWQQIRHICHNRFRVPSPATLALLSTPRIQFARFMTRNSARKISHVIKNSSERKSNGHHKSCIHYPTHFSSIHFSADDLFYTLSCNGKILKEKKDKFRIRN